MESIPPFLTADWRRLINITYAVPPEVLMPYTPKGIQLDVQNNQAFVSFVAFDFLKTRVKGIAIPFHTHFTEANLRFYVKYGDQRGVCFIREFVPRRAIAAVAQWGYNEPYKAIKISSQYQYTDDYLHIRYQLKYPDNNWHEVRLLANRHPFVPDETTIEHYFKEHQWGFGKNRKGQTLRYQVQHNPWAIYPVKDYVLKIDFAKLYGQDWHFLNTTTPINVICAEGSPIAVYPPQTLP